MLSVPADVIPLGLVRHMIFRGLQGLLEGIEAVVVFEDLLEQLPFLGMLGVRLGMHERC